MQSNILLSEPYDINRKYLRLIWVSFERYANETPKPATSFRIGQHIMAKKKNSPKASPTTTSQTPPEAGTRLLPLPPLREVHVPAMRTERFPKELSGVSNRIEEVLGHLADAHVDPLMTMCMDICKEPNPPEWATTIVVGTYDVVSARLWSELREQSAES